LTTRFCKIRLAKPAPDKAFGGIKIKKYLLKSAPDAKTLLCKMPTELYFGGEIHTSRPLDPAQENSEGS